MATLNFNAAEVAPADDFSLLPAGDYPVVITDSEIKETRAGDGQYLQLTLQVVDGEFENRILWDRLNIQNPNEKAMEIAYRTLSSICQSIGVQSMEDSTELHDKPMLARVKVRRGSGDYSDSNEVKGYSAFASTADASAVRPAPTSAAPAPAAASVPPWAKK